MPDERIWDNYERKMRKLWKLKRRDREKGKVGGSHTQSPKTCEYYSLHCKG